MQQREEMLSFMKSVILSSKEILGSIQSADKNKEKCNIITETNIVFDQTNDSCIDENRENIKKISLLDYTNNIPRLALVFVIDINNENSFNEVLTFLTKLKEVEKNEIYKTDKICMLNKYDKSSDGKKISNVEAKLDPFGVSYYFVSALTGLNINRAVNDLIVNLRKKYFWNVE